MPCGKDTARKAMTRTSNRLVTMSIITPRYEGLELDVAILMVGYDLKEGEDYSNLIAAIKTYDKWWHHLDSTWIISTADSPTQVRDYLKQFLHSDDKILVATIGAPAAWKGFNDRGSSWLSANL